MVVVPLVVVVVVLAVVSVSDEPPAVVPVYAVVEVGMAVVTEETGEGTVVVPLPFCLSPPLNALNSRKAVTDTAAVNATEPPNSKVAMRRAARERCRRAKCEMIEAARTLLCPVTLCRISSATAILSSSVPMALRMAADSRAMRSPP